MISPSPLIGHELCQLTPVELDRLRHDHPALGIAAQLSIDDVDSATQRILQTYSPGDAVALIRSYVT